MNNTEHSEKRRIPLYIIIGFLGSGKTSMLNNLLGQEEWSNVGVIVNDFGSLNIDSSLLSNSSDILKTELSGGQIFCSCLSGTFVETINKYSDLPIDALFVEASGLAKPNPLLEIIEWAERTSNDAFDYQGMICLIDAERYFTLSQALLTLKEQVVYSDLFIINKCDLVDEEELSKLETELHTLKPEVDMIKTTFGKVPSKIIRSLKPDTEQLLSYNTEQYKGWGKQGRPVPMRLTPTESVSFSALDAFMKRFGKEALRMKGYIFTVEHGLILANGVGEHITYDTDLTEDLKSTLQPGLVVIVPGNSMLKISLGSHWREMTETDVTVHTG